jgi:hypothetical protein
VAAGLFCADKQADEHDDAGVLRSRLGGTRAETRSRLSAKGTSPVDSAGATVQSTAGSRGVRVGW